MSKIERKTNIVRNTLETQIKLDLNLDGTGKTSIKTGIGFLDHMLTLMVFWAGFDLELEAKGDLHIDSHHTIEDIGLSLGQGFREALLSHKEAKGIERIGNSKVPMDESLTEVCLDISGRSWLEWRGDEILPPVIANDEKDIWREFYKSFVAGAKINLHIQILYGKNGHHMLESIAKGFGRALKQAIKVNQSIASSTKGILDL